MKSTFRVTAALLLAATFLTTTAQDFAKMPFDVPSQAINLVCSAGDEAKTIAFYGTGLGLERIPDINLPGGNKMLRFLAGKTELKFIIIPGLAKREGGINRARGIRGMTVFAQDAEGTLARLKENGFDTKRFYDANGERLNNGFVADGEGNEVNIVFLPDSLDMKSYARFQVMLTVADMTATRKFYADLLGLTLKEPWSDGTGDMKYSFQAGNSNIKVVRVDPAIPAETGRHDQSYGMHYLQFICRDFDAVHKMLVEKQANIVMEPTPLGDLATILFVADPDGIIVEIVGPPRG